MLPEAFAAVVHSSGSRPDASRSSAIASSSVETMRRSASASLLGGIRLAPAPPSVQCFRMRRASSRWAATGWITNIASSPNTRALRDMSCRSRFVTAVTMVAPD
jgi:hypothetical protein